MIGRAGRRLHAGPLQWLRGLWGEANIHSRQKWAAVWPELERLPSCGLRVLDAGCAEGAWVLEVAARRPAWTVVGIDRDGAAIERARRGATLLRLGNVEVQAIDFLSYHPLGSFDVVLSVSSAHYLAADGNGPQLFRAFHQWLAPGGTLVLYAPRARAEVPLLTVLPPPFKMRDLFTREALSELCAGAGLRVERLSGVVGRAGTMAKQLSQATTMSRALRLATYPAQLALSSLDSLTPSATRRRSSALLLLARRPVDGGTQ